MAAAADAIRGQAPGVSLSLAPRPLDPRPPLHIPCPPHTHALLGSAIGTALAALAGADSGAAPSSGAATPFQATNAAARFLCTAKATDALDPINRATLTAWTAAAAAARAGSAAGVTGNYSSLEAAFVARFLQWSLREAVDASKAPTKRELDAASVCYKSCLRESRLVGGARARWGLVGFERSRQLAWPRAAWSALRAAVQARPLGGRLALLVPARRAAARACGHAQAAHPSHCSHAPHVSLTLARRAGGCPRLLESGRARRGARVTLCSGVGALIAGARTGTLPGARRALPARSRGAR